MISNCIIIILTLGIILTEIVIATGFILKEFHLLKKGQDPIKAIKVKMPKTEGQKIVEGMAREKARQEFLERG